MPVRLPILNLPSTLINKHDDCADAGNNSDDDTITPGASTPITATKLACLALQTDDLQHDITALNALSPEIIANQATINIGTIGHVAHGKSQTVKAISGVQTVRFKSELERNITIKLGYANAKIYKCEKETCPRPGCYKSYPSDTDEHPDCLVSGCGGRMNLLRHVSFVDCPGHDILMATMLNGAAVMDAALLLVAANELCPQPQTSEHLAAIEIMKLKHIVVLQMRLLVPTCHPVETMRGAESCHRTKHSKNKVDLVRLPKAEENHQQIRDFIKGTAADGAPIVPISAQLRYNIDAVLEYIVKKIPPPLRDFSAPPRLIIIRSFDINKPGSQACDLMGGVAGGCLLRGVLRLGQEVEIRPGVVTKDEEGRIQCKPIRTKVVSLLAEKNKLKIAVPGGLIGVGTLIDPQLTRGDRLIGHILGSKGSLPPIYTEITVDHFLLRRLLGVKIEDGKKSKVDKLTKGEVLMVNIGSTSEGGRVMHVKGRTVTIAITQPVVTDLGEKVALSRRIDKHWRLIGRLPSLLGGSTLE